MPNNQQPVQMNNGNQSLNINAIPDVDILTALLAIAQNDEEMLTTTFNNSQKTAQLQYNLNLVGKQKLVASIQARIDTLNNPAPEVTPA